MGTRVLSAFGACCVSVATAQAQVTYAGLDSLLAAGRYESAAAVFRAPGEGERDARRFYYHGRILMGLGEFAPAESRFTRAIQLDGRAADYWYWAGLAAHERMDRAGMVNKARLASRAIGRFREAVLRDSMHVQARTWLIQYLWKAPGIVGGDRGEAERHLAALDRLDRAQAHRVRGGLRWDARDYPAAEREYRALAQLAPRDAQAPYMIGRTRQERGDWPGAAAAFDSALRVDSTHLRAVYYRARAALETGSDGPRAEALIRRFIAQAQPLGSSWVAAGHATLGRLLEARGATEDAVRAYRSALAGDARQSEASERLAALGARP